MTFTESKLKGEKDLNLPNKLTMMRIVLVPVTMALMLLGQSIPAGIVFAIASITDFFDGYIARKNNLVTSFGKIMDPLADKILVFGALLCFIQNGTVNVWPPFIIIARELFVTCMRVVAVDKGKVIAASWWGKIKTNVQIFAVLFAIFFENIYPTAATIVLWIAAGFTLLSWIAYIFENIEVFKD